MQIVGYLLSGGVQDRKLFVSCAVHKFIIDEQLRPLDLRNLKRHREKTLERVSASSFTG